MVEILNFEPFVTRVTDLDATVKNEILDFGQNRPGFKNNVKPCEREQKEGNWPFWSGLVGMDWERV